MNRASFTLPSFAKINWHLRVLGRRDDGFHELCTVFQTVSLRDRLTFTAAEQMILTCDDPKIPTDNRNLIVRAAELLLHTYRIKKGARIHLAKRIPAPGGLGGGSSNAAAALLGLIKLWEIEMSFDELNRLGSEIGSDVPFFFYGGTAAGAGRGTEIRPVEDLTEKFLLIVTPPIDISTREAFARLGAPRLTNENAKSILQICHREAQALDLRRKQLKNDFETSVFAAAPEIERAKEKLLELGAIQALLSGSGASVFAIFDSEETRQTAEKALEYQTDWRKFAVATISRTEYREALKQCDSLLPISF